MDKRELLAAGLFTIPGASNWSGLHRSRLYELMSTGELAFVKIGKRRLIPRNALIDLAERGLHGA